jgi:CRISPR type I-E-associated protein CasB/Cse2
MARRIRNPVINTGALASLRRGSAHDVARQAAFHRLLAAVPDHEIPTHDLIRWAAVAQCMALTGIPSTKSESDGTAMAHADLSESRFARLLASHGDGFRDQLLLVARYLHSKDTSLNWYELGELTLTDGINEERADTLRLRLARDYYRALTISKAS